jgi:hypothetical protein
MMMLLDDLRLALRQICRTFGLSGTALTVIPLVILGVALNIAALGVMKSMRTERDLDRGHTKTLGSAARTELKVMRTVLVSTLKKIGSGQKKWCPTQRGMTDRRTEGHGYQSEVRTAQSGGGGCDVEIVGSHRRKTTVATVQC